MDFTELLFSQFEEIRRPLPWRTQRTPYRIWISEVMLQQTTVQQAIPYFQKFMARFPDLNSLARAQESEVLRLWQGLGYYSRARKLWTCAREIVEKFKGQFPTRYEDLIQLPGIGPYTAAAIASIAFQQAVPALDGNISRVTARAAGIWHPVGSASFRKDALQWLERHMPRDNPGAFNEALMEVGALLCTPLQPRCAQCGLKSACFAYKEGLQQNLPLKMPRKAKTKLYVTGFYIKNGQGVALIQRNTKGLWAGMYDFPSLESQRPLSDKTLIQKFSEKFGCPVKILPHPKDHAEFILTHRKIFYTLVQAQFPTSEKACFQYFPEAGEGLPLARAPRHFLNLNR